MSTEKAAVGGHEVLQVRQVIADCWEGRRQHQRTKVQILVAAATILCGILAVTGMMAPDGSRIVRLGSFHSLMFVMVFSVMFFYFKYQCVRIYMYDTHRCLAEDLLNRMTGIREGITIRALLDHRDECSSACAKWLLRLAGAFIIVIWISISVLTASALGVDEKSLTVTWLAVATLSLSVISIGIGTLLEHLAKSKIRLRHARNIQAGTLCGLC